MSDSTLDLPLKVGSGLFSVVQISVFVVHHDRQFEFSVIQSLAHTHTTAKPVRAFQRILKERQPAAQQQGLRLTASRYER